MVSVIGAESATFGMRIFCSWACTAIMVTVADQVPVPVPMTTKARVPEIGLIYTGF